MNIGNGYITGTKEEALYRARAKSGELQLIPLPFIAEAMEYYISREADVYGIHRYNGFYLTTKLAIGKRYKKGPIFKVSLDNGKDKEIYLAYALYYTFTLKRYQEGILLRYKDGNPYNLMLSNIVRADNESYECLSLNLRVMKDLYKVNYSEICLKVYFYFTPYLNFEDCKDIVSESFYELCLKSSDFGVGLWVKVSKDRASDFLKFHNRFDCIDSITNQSAPDGNMELDFLRFLKGEKEKNRVRLWSQGHTPTQIAILEGSTIGTVGASITRGIQAIRKKLNKELSIC